MSDWKGKTRGNLLGYRIFVSILRTLGPKAAYALLVFVSLYFVLFSGSESRATYTFLRKKMSKGRLTAFFGIWKTFFKLGQNLIDKVAILSGLQKYYTYEFDGEMNLQEIVNRNEGGVLISGHLGNWDIAANFLNNLDGANDIYVVMMDAEHQKVKDFMESTQTKKQFNIIPIKDDGSHIFMINEILRDNKLICIHGDRFVEGQKTKTFDFIDGKAKFPMGPFRIASALNKPVSFVYAMKDNLKHYHLYGSPIKQGLTSQELMALFVKDLEEKTIRYPYQWFNFYNYWIE